MMMQVEVSSRAGIDTLKRIACGVQSFPLIGVTWQGANGTKIVLIELHAYHSTARMRGTGVSVALFTAETFEPVVGGWTVVLESLTCLFDTVIGHLANLAGLWTTTRDYSTFVIDEVVDDIGVERPGRVYFAWQSWVVPHSASLDHCGATTAVNHTSKRVIVQATVGDEGLTACPCRAVQVLLDECFTVTMFTFIGGTGGPVDWNFIAYVS